MSSTSDLKFFQFEADFVASLRCIPMQVRYKLDSCGIKLKLEQWHQFSVSDREILVTKPCDTPEAIADYRAILKSLIAKYTDMPAQELEIEPLPPWHQTTEVPPEVNTQAQKFATTITLEQWCNLSVLERFALCKLSRHGHENRNFLAALQEFHLTAPSLPFPGKYSD
jgi:hypothetical protein